MSYRFEMRGPESCLLLLNIKVEKEILGFHIAMDKPKIQSLNGAITLWEIIQPVPFDTFLVREEEMLVLLEIQCGFEFAIHPREVLIVFLKDTEEYVSSA